MNEKPVLNEAISIEDFKDFYWNSTELVEFCKLKGIDTTGGKLQIVKNIEKFLLTGEIVKKQKVKVKKKVVLNNEPLTLNTLITENYRNTQKHREFFKNVIGDDFHFTTHFMNFCKNNPDKTLGDAVNEWYHERELRKNGKKTNIGKQFQFNQYFRDFFSDPQNKGKTRKDALEAWEKRKQIRGEKKYNPKERL